MLDLHVETEVLKRYGISEECWRFGCEPKGDEKVFLVDAIR